MRKENFACWISIGHSVFSYTDYSLLDCNAVFGIISSTFRRNLLRPSSVSQATNRQEAVGKQKYAALQPRRSLSNHCFENLKCSLQLLLYSFLLGLVLNIEFIFNMRFSRFVYLCATDTWTMVNYVVAGSNFRYRRFHFIRFRWCLKHHITRLS